MVSIVTQILSVFTVIAQAVSVFLLMSLLWDKYSHGRVRIAGAQRAEARYSRAKFFADNAILFAFIVAFTSMSGSLFYSEVAGYEPCLLCWYQRILMYPQVFLFGLALWRKEKVIVPYALLLSAVGAAIAGYHYLLQIGIVPELPCAATGYSAACSQRFVMNFGYITIPMMALSAFALIMLLMLASISDAAKNRD